MTLRQIKHAFGKHEWRTYAILEGPMRRVCVAKGCDRVEIWEDGEWKEKKTE